jgi:hypothetical protein
VGAATGRAAARLLCPLARLKGKRLTLGRPARPG